MTMHVEVGVKIACIAVLLWTSVLFAQDPTADLLLIHGHILTMDSKDSAVEAIAIRDGTIIKVGSDSDVLAFANNSKEAGIIDLKGLTATPGLIDTHAHIAEGGVAELYDVKLSDATSIAEIIVRVKAKVSLSKLANGSQAQAGMKVSLQNTVTLLPRTLMPSLRTIRFGLCIRPDITV